MPDHDATTLPPRRVPSKRLRFEVLKRDGHTCRYCGATAPDVKLTVDHVVPVALGGSDDPSNLVTACQDCNSGKSSVSPHADVVADVDAKALLWASALERAAEIRRAEVDEMNVSIDAACHYWTTWRDSNDNTVPTDHNWRQSMGRFLAAGLSVGDLAHLTKLAMESRVSVKDTWKYFCGCCWKEITGRQDLAAKLLDTSPPEPIPVAPEPLPRSSRFDDEYEIGYQDGFSAGESHARRQGAVEAEEAYAEGFRRGAARLAEHEDKSNTGAWLAGETEF